MSGLASKRYADGEDGRDGGGEPRCRLGVTCYLVSQQNPDKLRLAFAAWGRRQAETVVSAVNTTQPQASASARS